MKAEVIMERELFGQKISQKSKSEFFSATDLVRAGNKWRAANGMDFFNMSKWFQNQSTKEFMGELEKKYGRVKISASGRGNHTWVHPLLFIDMALAISPKLKIEVYEWLFDKLIQYRNDSGDSYKEMCGALYVRTKNMKEFPRLISEVAGRIKISCGVKDWETASESQLNKRDNIHRAIVLFSRVLTDPTIIVEMAISEYSNKN